MRKRYVGCLAGAALLAVLGWAARPFLPGRVSRRGGAGIRAIPGTIRTAKTARKDFRKEIPWFGVVESKVRIEIRALVAARVLSVEAADGALVKKGALLFTLGGPAVENVLSPLEKEIASLEDRAGLQGEKVRLLEQAFEKRLTNRENLLAARNDLASLGQDLAAAKSRKALLLSSLSLRAPAEGVFTGRAVSPGQDVAAGEKLASLVGRKDLRVRATLFPPPGARLAGKKAALDLPGGDSIPLRVTRVLPLAAVGGAAVVFLEGPGLEKRVRPGEEVRGALLLFAHRKARAVPAGALVRDAKERTYVYVRGAKGFERRAVRAGLESGGWVEVLSGLEGGEEVVTRGAYELFYRDFDKIYQAED